jgi:uncharacterized protein with FMN-binding domain
MAQGGSNRKVANSLLAAGAAAVMAVYAAGYERTQSAAEQLEAQSAVRRPIARSAARPAAAPSTPAVEPQEQREPSRELAVLAHPSLIHPSEPTPVVTAPAPTPAKTDVAPAAPSSSPAVPTPEPVAPAPPPAPAAIVAAPTPVSAAPAAPAAAVYKDGTYKGWGTCRHGDIEAQVVIEAGRIASASISQCLTRYSCDVIGRLPPQVIQRQSAEVDYVTGATESANAFYYAVLGALGKAK